MKEEDFKALRSLPGNGKCADCGAKNPEWGSISLGTLFCSTCSGEHRGLGTHISRVRSIKMDSWSADQVNRMKKGGNENCQAFLKRYNLDFDKLTIRQRYDSPPAELYRSVLDARMAGKPEPTELPKPTEQPTNVPKKMEGFGSSPPPPPADAGRGVKLGAWLKLLCCFRCCIE